jgi:hypothetical protein
VACRVPRFRTYSNAPTETSSAGLARVADSSFGASFENLRNSVSRGCTVLRRSPMNVASASVLQNYSDCRQCSETAKPDRSRMAQYHTDMLGSFTRALIINGRLARRHGIREEPLPPLDQSRPGLIEHESPDRQPRKPRLQSAVVNH